MIYRLAAQSCEEIRGRSSPKLSSSSRCIFRLALSVSRLYHIYMYIPPSFVKIRKSSDDIRLTHRRLFPFELLFLFSLYLNNCFIPSFFTLFLTFLSRVNCVLSRVFHSTNPPFQSLNQYLNNETSREAYTIVKKKKKKKKNQT